MLKSRYLYLGILICSALIVSIPIREASVFRSSLASLFRFPLSFSSGLARYGVDLFYFRKIANENHQLKKEISKINFEKFQSEELRLENERLLRLLNFEKTTPAPMRRAIAARVIGRSPSTWNSAVLIDKGSDEGIKVDMVVLSENFLVGRTIEVGPKVSKVLLLTDPNSRIGALVQRTRNGGVLFGTSGGECRLKYLPVDSDVQAGDIVETAGFGGFFPKGLWIGKIEKIWKETTQMYQIATIKPMADLSRLEEVICAD